MAKTKKVKEGPLIPPGSHREEVSKELHGIKESNKKNFSVGDLWGRATSGRKKKKK